MNRQIVKSDAATIRIPELDFEVSKYPIFLTLEIPKVTQRGLLNTIEGFLRQSWEAIKDGQEERRVRFLTFLQLTRKENRP